MKTAISFPDELVVTADNLAQTLGIRQSELYAEAIRAYIGPWSSFRPRSIDIFACVACGQGCPLYILDETVTVAVYR